MQKVSSFRKNHRLPHVLKWSVPKILRIDFKTFFKYQSQYYNANNFFSKSFLLNYNTKTHLIFKIFLCSMKKIKFKCKLTNSLFFQKLHYQDESYCSGFICLW